MPWRQSIGRFARLKLRNPVRKVFFSEEKKQKTFDRAVAHSPAVYAKGKSFLVLFFKKEQLFLFGLRQIRAARGNFGRFAAYDPGSNEPDSVTARIVGSGPARLGGVPWTPKIATANRPAGEHAACNFPDLPDLSACQRRACFRRQIAAYKRPRPSPRRPITGAPWVSRSPRWATGARTARGIR